MASIANRVGIPVMLRMVCLDACKRKDYHYHKAVKCHTSRFVNQKFHKLHHVKNLAKQYSIIWQLIGVLVVLRL